MSDRPLSASEKALWQKFIESVEPLDRTKTSRQPVTPRTIAVKTAEAPRTISAKERYPVASAQQSRRQLPGPGQGLDGHWDRRLSKGMVQPDATVDLHGHSLSSAHGRLDSALELSIAAGHRAILLVTGKARSDEERQQSGGRGAIRASIADWLGASRHAPYIAAVRRAHPRHGGSGALYIILRRRRGT